MTITYHAGRRIQGLSTDRTSSSTSTSTYFNDTTSRSFTGSTTGTWTAKISPVSLTGIPSSSAYKVRFKMVVDTFTLDGGGSQPRECEGRTGFSSNTTWNGGSGSFLGIRTETVQWQGAGLYFWARDSTGWGSAQITSGAISGTYYFECENSNTGSVTLKMFDPTYTTQTGSTYTIAKNPQDLVYFLSEHHNNYGGQNLGVASLTTQNLKALGDVTTITDITPTNVQVGSRFEETDTRKMYHYNSNAPLIDESFASTPAMTWETNGGSSNMVYTVDTTTNHRAEQDSTGNASYTHGTCIGDIGQTLSNNWIMRINLVHTGWAAGEGGNQHINFWVSSKKQQTAGNADHAGLYWHTVQSSGGSGDGSGGAITGTYSGMYAFVSNEESTPAPTSIHNGGERIGTGVSNPVNGQNRYIEFIKNGNTFTMTDFGTDSTFTTSIDTMDIVDGDKNMKSSGSFNQSQMSAITGLRYIHLGLRGSDTSGGTYTVYCNMIKIWDNVTSVPTATHSWSEEGTT